MFASRLVMAGVDLPTVKELLGYKDISMTLSYSYLSHRPKALWRNWTKVFHSFHHTRHVAN